jgi:hypothetical protein
VLGLSGCDLKGAQTAYPGFDPVTGFQVGVDRKPNATRRSGHDHVTGLQRNVRRNGFNDFRDGPDHLINASVLLHIAYGLRI